MKRIKEAAIMYNGEVWTGHRHHTIFADMKTQYNEPIRGEEQGFITEDGEFVSRVDAAQIALAAGQIETPKAKLFSEDLY